MKKIIFALLALGSVLASDAIAAPTVGDVSSAAAVKQSQAEKIYYRRGYGPRYRYGFYGGPRYRYGYYRGPRYGYGGCVRARRVCAYRWGWGGPAFRRCMWRRAC